MLKTIPMLMAAAAVTAAGVAQAQGSAPTELAMASTTQPSVEARLDALVAANRQLTTQVHELRQQLASQQAQAPTPATDDERTVYVTSRADRQYENWYGLSIGDSWRLREDTPIRLIEPHQNDLAYTILPAGTVVTIIGAPRGVTGTYAVASGPGLSGWATLR